jgi:Ca2+-binding RTX toxin-like protein
MIPAELVTPRRPEGVVVVPTLGGRRDRLGLHGAGLAAVRFDLQIPEPGRIVDVVRSLRELTGPAVPLSLYGAGTAAAPTLQAAAYLGTDLAAVVARGSSTRTEGLAAPALLLGDEPDARRRTLSWLLANGRRHDPEVAAAILELLEHGSRRHTARRLFASAAIAGGSLVVAAPPAAAAVTVTDAPAFVVTITGAETVVVDCEGATPPSNVRVTVDGTATVYTTDCDEVTSLSVTGDADADNNSISIAGVIAPFAGLDGAITVNGGGGNDSITGSGFNDSLLGGAGDDTITGAAGNDAIDGGAGTDRVSESNDANFTLTNTTLTGHGNDTLAGIEQAALTGGAAANAFTATTFTGATTLTGGAGNDTFTGGSGTDRVVETGDVNFTLTNTSLTGNGTDTLASIEQAALTGGAGNNTINASAFTGPVTLDGAAGNDVLTGGAAADSLTGGAGNDTLTGGGGNDTLAGGDGTDRVVETTDATNVALSNTSLTGIGTDVLSGIEEASITGGGGGNGLDAANFTGAVTLDGGAGNDTLFDGPGSHNLIGGPGDDTITGAGGNDTIAGGDGTDTIRESGDLNLTLSNAALTGLGNDTLSGIERADLTGGDGGNVLDAASFAGNVTLDGGAGPDTLVGGLGSDLLLGEGDNDRIKGGAGDDTLQGSGGADRLSGNEGKDVLNGAEGKDTLRGGPGKDKLRGGPGRDKEKQ